MTSPNSQANAINIGPDASSSSHMNHGIQMASGSVGSAGGDAYSPPGEAYSPPTFTYTTADGNTAETMANMANIEGTEGLAASSNAGGQRDRRYSDEWDASKVPPSRFQKRKGSIYSTQGSRDGHVDNNYAAKFHAKHAEKGYNKVK